MKFSWCIQVGDVVLVEDESVMENDCKIIGLDTLVGVSDICCFVGLAL